jgi:hypothetical protein
MIKRLELIGPSCLTNAKDDEPIFVLKSTDELAPQTVRTWAHWYIGSKGDGAATPQQRAKFEEALALADQMEAWRAEANRRRNAALNVGSPSRDPNLSIGSPLSDSAGT